MRDLLPHVDIPWHLLLATPFMLCVFAGIVWFVFRRDRKSIYERVQGLPFEDQ